MRHSLFKTIVFYRLEYLFDVFRRLLRIVCLFAYFFICLFLRDMYRFCFCVRDRARLREYFFALPPPGGGGVFERDMC